MVATTNLALSPRKCSLCDRDLSEVTCPTLLASDTEKRSDIVKTRMVCFGCLRRGHQRRQCCQPSKCAVDSYGKGHHYLLHTPEPKEELKLQELLSVELPPENRRIHCGKAQGNKTGAVKVALKNGDSSLRERFRKDRFWSSSPGYRQ